ncbi:MAG TPA: hypothetical protein VFV19_08265 [Candidatus Polarisedimenticolaceae bacterium]|nr:hypothetical protein [Candidatus Polarisedimenticolaceae bacterium]
MRRLRNVRAAFALLTSLVAMLGPAVGAAPTGSELIGDWQGAIDTGNGLLHVVFHLTQDKDGKLTGTMDSPDQKATGITISSISITEQDVQLTIDLCGCKYDGKLDKDKHQIVGVWKQGPASLPLILNRAGK